MDWINPLTLKDGYKVGHVFQYPKNTQFVQSNLTARGTRIPGIEETIFVGLQYFLKQYLDAETGEFAKFFNAPKEEVLTKYKRRMDAYLGPDAVTVEHLAALHDLGYLPLEFRAVPEGTAVPLRVPMVIVENTHPEFGWLTNFIETLLSNIIWMPITSATTARRLRTLLDEYAVRTGSPQEFVQFQGHDFSMRGMAGIESAALSGLGHLTSFVGTDTLPAIDLIEAFYAPRDPNYMVGVSVPATEHSVMCAGGMETEEQTFLRLLDLYQTGIVSVVSDTWDLWNVLTNILPANRDKILARDGKLVVRPDSGDPVKIICGDPKAKTEAERKGVIELLWDTFGGTLTETGHKLLDSHVGAIYGDSITYERAEAILVGLEAKGFASANMVFGVGSFTYQYVTRDTFAMAMKATHATIDGVGYDLFKDPVTDDGMKKSAKGRLAVLMDATTNKMVLVNQANERQESLSVLTPVWRDGKLLREDTIEDIRERVAA